MRQDQIPYGVKDFKRIRLEGRYFVDKSDYALLPDTTIRFGGVSEQSYVIELKHAPKDASDTVLAQDHADALGTAVG